MAITNTSTPSFSTLGVGSGLDLQGMVDKLSAIEQQPLQNLQKTATKFNAKLSVYGQIQSLASALNSAVDVTDRAVVQAVDRSYVYRAGGGEKNDDVGSSDIATMQALRDVLAHQRQNNVPEMPDGTCHVHIDPVVEGQLFRDDEFKLLFRGSLGNATPYQDFVVQRILGCTFYRNTENPLPGTVVGRGTGTRGYDVRDPFVGELYNNGNSSTGVVLHRALFVWGDACMEYAADLQQLITEAGVQGKVSNSIVTPNGITIDFDKFQFLIMAPSNRLANKVPITWQLWADWVMRTDACTGDDARYKRTALAVFGE